MLSVGTLKTYCNAGEDKGMKMNLFTISDLFN